jgi:hypothetical protein
MIFEKTIALLCFVCFFYALTIFSCASVTSSTPCQNKCLEEYRINHFEKNKDIEESGKALNDCNKNC